ncbi:MAG: hemin ABC transporter substrate-binding protein, partial [Moritella sp.]|uniref:ABC transporter substrate-binding protein n=1 Tax=Moritella sp. TaxID=78556 RepID=UPI0029A8B802|nr:hemin ABC transporter substrate-binding protein [Moritella sp.]
GKNTSIDEIIILSGAVNPANSVIESYKPLSYEAIIQLQPDYILVSDRDFSPYGSVDKLLADFPLLKATPAGLKGQIMAVQGSALIGGFGLESIKLAKTLQLNYAQDQD